MIYETTALVLVEEFAHRVLNEYTHAIADLTLAARSTEDTVVRRRLLAAADRLHAHALAHRALAMPRADVHCDVAEYMSGVCAAVANALSWEAGVQLQIGDLEVIWPGERCWRLALIVSELIHNAARHGGRNHTIAVALMTAGPDLICRVSNEGPCSPSSNPGRGRRVVAALAAEIGGHADWQFTASGACAWVAAPLNAPRRDPRL
ncbi:ATP-binding protein [Phenylobacterium sp.]|uniref:histidine kinase dimerization/phosphoacceptor domain -containing protein n=1 Tax=Phenylobacterium sp. TaxID=1871053 RepID=UPI0011FCC0AD|nr:ATP-binding protein [Phenylobacterium sp.]THD60589.1 MAG: ATP-binding protein [Phenylobacterium sp.]